MPPSPICVQILSDIHAEFGPHALLRPNDVDTGADIVIIAGDLAVAPNNVETATRLFPAAAALVLIGGNHEHYRTDLPINEGLDLMRRAAAEISAREDRIIAVLEDAGAVLRVRGAAVRVLGSTFWTDYGLHHKPITEAQVCERSINDHRLIQGRDGGFLPLAKPQLAIARRAPFLAMRWPCGMMARRSLSRTTCLPCDPSPADFGGKPHPPVSHPMPMIWSAWAPRYGFTATRTTAWCGRTAAERS